MEKEYYPDNYMNYGQNDNYMNYVQQESADLKFLRKAREIAKEILNPKESPQEANQRNYTNTFPIIIDRQPTNYNNTEVNIGNRTTVNNTYVTNHPEKKKKSEKEEKKEKKEKDKVETTSAIVIGVISSIITLYLTYQAGKSWKSYQEIQEDINKFRKSDNKWTQIKEGYLLGYQKEVNKVGSSLSEILNKRRSDAIKSIALIVFGLISAGVAVVGAIYRSKKMIQIAAVIGFIDAAVAIFMYASSNTTHFIETKAKKINDQLDKIDNKYFESLKQI